MSKKKRRPPQKQPTAQLEPTEVVDAELVEDPEVAAPTETECWCPDGPHSLVFLEMFMTALIGAMARADFHVTASDPALGARPGVPFETTVEATDPHSVCSCGWHSTPGLRRPNDLKRQVRAHLEEASNRPNVVRAAFLRRFERLGFDYFIERGYIPHPMWADFADLIRERLGVSTFDEVDDRALVAAIRGFERDERHDELVDFYIRDGKGPRVQDLLAEARKTGLVHG